METLKEPIKPRSHEVQISANKSANTYVFAAKQALREFGKAEFHALGTAAPLAVVAAENLVRNKYATITRIETQTVPLPVKDGSGEMKKAKIVVEVAKADTFEEAMVEFEKNRKETADKKEQESKDAKAEK